MEETIDPLSDADAVMAPVNLAAAENLFFVLRVTLRIPVANVLLLEEKRAFSFLLNGRRNMGIAI